MAIETSNQPEVPSDSTLTTVPKQVTNVPIMSSITYDSIAAALFGKTRRAVLGLLLSQPERSFFLREVARKTGAGQGAVQRELKQLSKAGIITRSRRGNQIHFQADTKCPVFPELRSLLLKTSGAASLLQKALIPIADRIEVAFVFGSLPKGEATPQSDVDVIIVGNTTLRDIVTVLSPLQEAIGREINPTVYAANEFSSKAAHGHHFVNSIMQEPKWFLIGDEHELEKLAE
jgi:predicted nucleotidyltransferase